MSVPVGARALRLAPSRRSGAPWAKHYEMLDSHPVNLLYGVTVLHQLVRSVARRGCLVVRTEHGSGACNPEKDVDASPYS
jgi:hypothetical protein